MYTRWDVSFEKYLYLDFVHFPMTISEGETAGRTDRCVSVESVPNAGESQRPNQTGVTSKRIGSPHPPGHASLLTFSI